MSSGWRTGFLLDLVVFFALCILRPHPFPMHRPHPHRRRLPLLLPYDVLHDFSLLLTSQYFSTLFFSHSRYFYHSIMSPSAFLFSSGNDIIKRYRMEQEVAEYLASSTSTPSPTICLLYTSPSPRDRQKSRMPSSA